MPVLPYTDHIAQGLLKPLEQFKGKPVFEAILTSFLTQIQKLEDAAWEVITIRGIEDSEGIGLDHIGTVVGRPRMGLDDTDYRIALRAQIRINRSCGTCADVIAVTLLSLPNGYHFIYDEPYPATIEIEIVESLSFSIRVLFDNLIRTKSGGVRLLLLFTDEPEDRTFAFAPADVSITDIDRGLGDLADLSAGGSLLDVLVG